MELKLILHNYINLYGFFSPEVNIGFLQEKIKPIGLQLKKHFILDHHQPSRFKNHKTFNRLKLNVYK